MGVGRRVHADDQAHLRAGLAGIHGDGQRAQGILAVRQGDLAKAVGVALQAADVGQPLAVFVGGVIRQHPEAQAAVGGRQRIQLGLEAAPARGGDAAGQRIADFLRGGA
ncbi:hypothetical protein G6F53_014191 [Rhizopus delemar]|nr:hypothetical protein G6F53_014191 [Rhizopus delemar]